MRQGIRLYTLVDLKDEKITGQIYESEMTKVEKNQDSLCFIGDILKKKKVGNKTLYLCSFVGFPKKFNMWLDSKEVKDVTADEELT